MYPMLRIPLKAPVTRVITPLCRAALALGITPNQITVLGGIGVWVSALWAFPMGKLFTGTIVVTLFVLSDLFDGTMARISDQGASRWGALLDATIDRVSDAAILCGVVLYLVANDDRLAPVAVVALVAGFLVSYIKAKAESLDIECEGGFAERTERLIIVLLSTGLAGLGVPYILAIGVIFLAASSTYTVCQRLIIVYRGSR